MTLMMWILGIGIGGIVVAVAVWAWVRQERNGAPDYGTISDQWRNERRAKDREFLDR